MPCHQFFYLFPPLLFFCIDLCLSAPPLLLPPVSPPIYLTNSSMFCNPLLPTPSTPATSGPTGWIMELTLTFGAATFFPNLACFATLTAFVVNAWRRNSVSLVDLSSGPNSFANVAYAWRILGTAPMGSPASAKAWEYWNEIVAALRESLPWSSVQSVRDLSNHGKDA